MTDKNKMKILLWGGRSKARIVLEMIKDIYGSKADVIAIFDKTLSHLPFASEVDFYNLDSDLTSLIKKCTHYVMCIGGEHGFARYMISKKLEEKNLKSLDLISKFAIVDQLDLIGRGIQIMPGAIAHKFTKIGDQCILNTNSTVEHECNLGNGVHTMPGSCIAGLVNIGNYSTIGTNATILPKLQIGENVYVGAGAVVTKNVESNSIVAGIPAKFMKKFTPKIDLEPFK